MRGETKYKMSTDFQTVRLPPMEGKKCQNYTIFAKLEHALFIWVHAFQCTGNNILHRICNIYLP